MASVRPSAKAGLPPGTLVHVGERKRGEVALRLTQYSDNSFDLIHNPTMDECREARKKEGVCWLHVDGLHDPEIISRVGSAFRLHKLLQEDVLDTKQPPKIEEYPHAIFIVLKSLRWDEKKRRIAQDHVSIVIGKNFVVSFTEFSGIFYTIEERLQSKKGSARSRGADFLAYRLIDTIVDEYLLPLERLGDAIEDIEEDINNETNANPAQEIHTFRTKLNQVRKGVGPFREALMRFDKKDNMLIHEETWPYIEDVQDHLMYVSETISGYRDALGSLLDLHLSLSSHKMNQIMRVLTVITTIFIPLTFITGIYGMNFANMPELSHPSAYFVVLSIMVLLAITMTLFFKVKKWM